MVKIQKRTVKTNGSYQLILQVKGSSWISHIIESNYKNKNFEMTARYLKVSCEELKKYFIATKDMLNLQQLQSNVYQVDILKYKEL